MKSIKQWIKRNRESAWKLGVLINGFEDLKNNQIQYISNGKYDGKKWFADPFVLHYDEKNIWLLVEEYDYKINRGRIAKICIDRATSTIVDCVILLDLPTHLSFPAIYRIDEKVYVCPENNCAGTFDLYEYDEEKEKLKRIKQIVSERLTDAIIYHDNGRYFLLTTYEPKPNGAALTIFSSEEFDGPYKPYEVVNFKENIARNAGEIFEYKGKLIRPAQESNYSYGHCLSFQEMKIKETGFSFTEFYRMSSPHLSCKYGMHTYNEYKGLGIVDFKGDRNAFIGTAFRIIQKIEFTLGIKKRRLLQ